MISTQRPVQTPCQWCGAPIMQPARGRLLHYCDRSHRQRAYEARTAARRLGADIDAGLVRSEPAERIVERVVRAQHPHTAAGWQTALEELRAQLADGRIGAWDAQRLQRTVALVDQQLRAIGTSWQPQRQQSAAPHRGSAYIDERLAAAIGAQIQAAGGNPVDLARTARRRHWP